MTYTPAEVGGHADLCRFASLKFGYILDKSVDENQWNSRARHGGITLIGSCAYSGDLSPEVRVSSEHISLNEDFMRPILFLAKY